jgi:hypothetical protein
MAMGQPMQQPMQQPQIPRGKTHAFATGAATIASRVTKCGLFLNVISFAAGACGIGGALMSWNEDCDQPLKWWLLFQGLLDAIMGLLGLFAGMNRFPDADVLEYQVHKQRDGAYDPDMEEELEDFVRQEQKGQMVQQVSTGLGCCPFLFLCCGIYWYRHSFACAEILTKCTYWLLMMQAFKLAFLCCCVCPVILGSGIGVAHAMGDTGDGSDSDSSA